MTHYDIITTIDTEAVKSVLKRTVKEEEVFTISEYKPIDEVWGQIADCYKSVYDVCFQSEIDEILERCNIIKRDINVLSKYYAITEEEYKSASYQLRRLRRMLAD